ncbi:MAG: MarR family transcriptional regulator [Faecalibacterium sp.]|nr:MarR family transcriptional regulator [Ruminococcus sp.]MCM1392610.1 MarR family transcriptional regulator [Ruminococcus sp.]MCM1486531.1 MarR family transcriptional regulator [Faecalibacterium sp.]
MEHKRSISFELHKTSRCIKRIIDCENHCDMPSGTRGRIIGFIFDSNCNNRDVFQRDIEKEFNIRRSTATNILKLMERDGFIVRESVDYDARLKKIVLTQKAHDVHNTVIEKFKTLEKRLSKDISQQDLDVFFSVIDKVNQNLKEDDAND